MNVVTPKLGAVALGETGLTVPLTGGARYFNYHWLRDNCPTSFDPVTRERSFDILHLATPPRAGAAHVEGDALVIDWADEDHVTRMPLDWLIAYADGQRRPDPAALPRKPWYGDHYADVPRFTHAELMEDSDALRRWTEALIVEGISIVGGMPDTDAGLTTLANRIGQVRPTFFGDYFDVRVHLKPTNLAYTSAALEMHTDVPAEEHAPGIQFLHMRRNSVVGGRNLFGDGVAVANDFREIDPEGFALLAETEIPFFCEHDDFDMRAYQRVIELDRHGAVEGLTFSQHLLDIIDLPQEFLDSWYPAFCRFGKMLQDPKYVMEFTLAAGECIVFDNHRVVHGRAGYTADSGERHLRGTYTDRAEMRSTYRRLVSAGRFGT